MIFALYYRSLKACELASNSARPQTLARREEMVRTFRKFITVSLRMLGSPDTCVLYEEHQSQVT